jgi:hypothetical protein
VDELIAIDPGTELGDPRRGRLASVGEQRELGAQAFEERTGKWCACLGHDQGELVAAHPIGAIASARGTACGLSECLQALVATPMPMPIVDLLQMVEVNEHERRRTTGTVGLRESVIEVFVKCAVTPRPTSDGG